jgi:secreted PhoX family phosphatase
MNRVYFLMACGFLSFSSAVDAQPYTWTTIAGTPNVFGSADGTNQNVVFNYPDGLALDPSGTLYISDAFNCTIRRMRRFGSDLVVDTLVGRAGVRGSTDGTNNNALFSLQDGIALDPSGNLYVADYLNCTIRKVSPVGTNWVVTTLAGLAGSTGRVDGTNNGARFWSPEGIAVHPSGTLLVTELDNHDVRAVTPVGTNWVVTTIAGRNMGSADGTNNAAQFRDPYDIATDPGGNAFVPDNANCDVRELTLIGTNWVTTRIAGLAQVRGNADGTNSDARFGYPESIAADNAGNVFVGDSQSNTVRKITHVGTNWVVTTIGGMPGVSGTADGTGSAARFESVQAIAVDADGNLYVADAYACTIRFGRFIPQLGVTVSGTQLVLSWPVAASNYVLETSSTLLSGNSWTPVASAPVLLGDTLRITNLVEAPTAFFRLRRP